MDRVQVEHLGKVYRLGERANLRETLGGVAVPVGIAERSAVVSARYQLHAGRR